MTLPLLIGGATTSKVHTALRIDPAYEGPVIHVLDASRAVGVASSLVSRHPARAADREDRRRTITTIREARAGRGQSELATLAEARANAFPCDPAGKAPPPQRPGVHSFNDWPLRELRDGIDWTPFFRAWELAGNYPAILEDEVVGESATQPVRRRPGDARPDHRRALADGARHGRPVALPPRGRRHPRPRRQ